ncbi:MAG TPA: hypothetical protein VFZ53_21200 [Polyangiaceae bacterium]
MRAGPLDDARLRAIEECLNRGRYDEAQRKLAALATTEGLDQGLAYLSARLLFHRGRLDAASIANRLRDVLKARPDFAEARRWLETVERSQAATQPPPGGVSRPPPLMTRPAPPNESPAVSQPPFVTQPPGVTLPPVVTYPPARLETPRVPGTGAVITLAPRKPASLGTLELPKSELPTEPAPPPDSMPQPVRVEPAKPQPGPWDPLELALASGKRDAVLSGLDKLAARDLDALLRQKTPKFADIAGEVSRFLSRAPIARYFCPFDLTLDSVERLDAIVALLVPPGVTEGHYALRVSLSAYLGECVRASGGRWEGSLAEPESAAVVREGGRYVPWNEVAEALGAGQSLRAGAGPPPHPGAEPPDEVASVATEAPTPWDPARWPTLQALKELTRALATSALGVWAARCAKVPLDRTPGSLRALDGYASLLNARGKSPGSADGWVRHAGVLAGGYLGELLCLHTGGRFSENDAAPEGPLRYEVLLPDGRAAYPLLFAFERFGGKRLGTFSKFFEEHAGR